MSDRRWTARRASYSIAVDPDNGTEEADWRQCCHCFRVWKIEPGSGKTRGYCSNCNGLTCGPDCQNAAPGECVPKEKWLDCVERGVDPKTVTTICGGWSPSPGGILVPAG